LSSALECYYMQCSSSSRGDFSVWFFVCIFRHFAHVLFKIVVTTMPYQKQLSRATWRFGVTRGKCPGRQIDSKMDVDGRNIFSWLKSFLKRSSFEASTQVNYCLATSRLLSSHFSSFSIFTLFCSTNNQYLKATTSYTKNHFGYRDTTPILQLTWANKQVIKNATQ